MSGWNDPRFVITVLLIVVFGYAYYQDPSDQAMKGAIIAAFSAAYGFWLGSQQNEESTAHPGKAPDPIRPAQDTPALPLHIAAKAANAVADAATDRAEEIADDTGNAKPFI